MGAHFLAIKDMAGLCRPLAARKLVKALKEEIGLPIHFHTHDTSGITAASVLQAGEAGVDIVDLAIASMSGSTSQPNLNSIVAALAAHPARHAASTSTRAQRILRLLGRGARVLRALRRRAEDRQRRGLSPRNARRPIHQPQRAGGQHGRGAPLAGDRPALRRGQPALRRHRQGHALLEGGRRHGPVPLQPRHPARGRGEPRARGHAFPGERHRHVRRRLGLAAGRLAGTGLESGARGGKVLEARGSVTRPPGPKALRAAGAGQPGRTSRSCAPSFPRSSSARRATTISIPT